MIKSHLLYQLSYAPGNRPGKPSQEGVVYQSDPPMSSKVSRFPRHNPLKGKTKKPPESGGLCAISIDLAGDWGVDAARAARGRLGRHPDRRHHGPYRA